MLPPENYFCLRSTRYAAGLRSLSCIGLQRTLLKQAHDYPITEREGPQIVSTRSADQSELTLRRGNSPRTPAFIDKTTVCLHARKDGSPLIVADENNSRR
jgi:hypothetical protein